MKQIYFVGTRKHNKNKYEQDTHASDNQRDHLYNARCTRALNKKHYKSVQVSLLTK